MIVDRFSFGTAVDSNGLLNPPGNYTVDVGLFRGFTGRWDNLTPSAAGPLMSVRFE